ncbi:MAG TPA: hypothetical protein VN903_35285 [Polyangia bacterium]|jgi:hypothetical protein|nr:hypothetical protein [Polyangia bacterium]
MTAAKQSGILCLLGVLACASSGCLALLAAPEPMGRSGRLTTADGASVANADVIVDSWTIGITGARLAREHTYRTKTDDDGRWAVPTRAVVRVGILAPDGLPVVADEFTFHAAGQTDLHGLFPERFERHTEPETSTMRADGSGRAPFGGTPMLVSGGMVGAGQKVSAHAGGMVVVSRGGFGAGGRVAAEIGVNGAGGGAGIVLVPVGGSFPNLAVELNARYLRSWRSGALAESGPEVGFDLIGYRFTLASLAPAIDAPPSGRRVVVGFGFGYF